jgi:hypothetical protein
MPAGKNAGGMELHRLHVPDRRDAGLEGERVADALADHGIGGDAIQGPRTAGGDGGGLGHVGDQLAGDQIADHRPVAAAAVVDQGQGFVRSCTGIEAAIAWSAIAVIIAWPVPSDT